jgi:hypothetical protein
MQTPGRIASFTAFMMAPTARVIMGFPFSVKAETFRIWRAVSSK